jgi:ribosome-associated protein
MTEVSNSDEPRLGAPKAPGPRGGRAGGEGPKAPARPKSAARPKPKEGAKPRAAAKPKEGAKPKAPAKAKAGAKPRGAASSKAAARTQADPKAKAAAGARAAARAGAATKPKAPAKPRAALKPRGPAPKKAAPRPEKKSAQRIPPESRELAGLVVRASLEHKIVSPVLINLRGVSQFTDFFYIATLENSRQVKAAAEKIMLRVKEAGGATLGVEGLSAPDARWALIDLGDVIVHLFQPEARALYDLEGLWADAPRVEMSALGVRKRQLKN